MQASPASSKQVTNAQASSKQVTNAQASSKQASSKQASSKQASSKQASNAQASSKQVTNAQASNAQASSKQASSKHASSKQVTNAQASSKQVTNARASSKEVTSKQVTNAQASSKQASSKQVTNAQASSKQVTNAQASSKQASGKPWVWSDWGVYIVSYLGANDQRDSASRLSRLVPVLAAMGMTSSVCAGKNTLMAGHGYISKVWLTHTAAVHQHARSARASNPCLVLEDDVEFLVDAAQLDAQLRRMFAFRPDYKTINLGALHAGASVPIGGSLAVSHNCLLAHSIVYSAEFCQQIVARGELVARPHLGECLKGLDLRDRLAAFPSLTTQSEWPASVPQLIRIAFGSFKQVHRVVNIITMFALPVTATVFGVAGLALLLSASCKHDAPTSTSTSTSALTAALTAAPQRLRRMLGFAAVVFAALLVVFAAVLNAGVANMADMDAMTNQAMTDAFHHRDFLQDFCPLDGAVRPDGAPPLVPPLPM